MSWQEILKNIQITSQRGKTKDIRLPPKENDDECRRWFEELFKECEEIKDYFSDYESYRNYINQFPEFDEDFYCRHRDAILSSEGFTNKLSVTFAPKQFVARGHEQEFQFRTSMVIYPTQEDPTAPQNTVCRFQLALDGEIYLRFRFKMNGIIHADSNMFDKLDSHVNAKGKISNLFKTVKNEARRRLGYEMV